MAKKVKLRLICSVPKWRIAVAKCVAWGISWPCAFGIIRDDQAERIIDRIARWVVSDIVNNSRVEWLDADADA